MIISLVFAVGLVLALPSAGRAFTYIDPGSGSMIVQVLFASALGWFFAFPSFWKNWKNLKFFSFFRRRRSDEKQPS